MTGNTGCGPTRRRLAAAAIAIAVVAAGALALNASAASGPKVKGPIGGSKKVEPGKRVKFKANGFTPGAELTVQLQPKKHRRGNCCGAGPKKTFDTRESGSRAGSAVLRFRFPRRWFRCAGASNCSAHKWKKGSRADVNACTVDVAECARKTVRIKG